MLQLEGNELSAETQPGASRETVGGESGQQARNQPYRQCHVAAALVARRDAEELEKPAHRLEKERAVDRHGRVEEGLA